MKVTRRLRDQFGSAAREVAEQARERLAERLGERIGDRLGDRLADRLEPTPTAPDAPGNRPRATYAGVLDGRHLWLAVDATPGTLAVREAGTDKVTPLASDLAEDDPRYRSVRSDLRSLPGEGAAKYDVVITAPGGKVHRVWTPPLPRGEPVRTPPDESHQWEVARSDDGTLELVRRPAAPGAVLVDIDIDADDVTTLRVSGAAPDAELRLVDDDTGEVLVTRPLTHEGGTAVATLRPADIPGGVGLSAAVHVGDLPVRRRANDLARPDNAVLLPQVQSDDGDAEAPLFAIILRWLPDGILRVRRPKGRAPSVAPGASS